MAAESLEREIRDLRALLFSERDPDGRGFAPLADALRRAGDLGQALELVREGVGRLPDFATGHVVSGWVHRARGEEDEAERSFRRVLELDEENVSALRGLGFLLADRGAAEEALTVFRRLNDLDPGDLEVQARLLELGDRAGAPRPDPAAASATTALPDAPAGAVARHGRVVDVGTLAPEGSGRPVVDIGALAPGTAPAGAGVGDVDEGGGSVRERPVVDVGELAPDEVHAGPDVPMVAPDEPEPDEEDDGEAAPAEVLRLRGRGGGEEAGGAGPEGPWTRTMAELYVRQGLSEQAARIYRHLVERSPDDEGLQTRLREVEADIEPRDEAPSATDTPEPKAAGADAADPEEDDADLEDLARHMATGPAPADESEGPFAWGDASATEEEADAGGEGLPVSEYLMALLAWRPGGGTSGGEGGVEGEPPQTGDGGGAGTGGSPAPGGP